MTSDDQRSDEPLDPRIYFAAERTLLAWIRTGLAMMGFGFVVARFGLFLRELAAAREVVPVHRTSVSLFVGTSLVLLGAIVNVAAALKHWYTIRRLERGRPIQFNPWSLGMSVAGLLGLLGLLTAIYLLVGLEH